MTVDGVYGSATRNAVLAAQLRFGLPQTGEVDFQTWDKIYNQYAGIENTTWRDVNDFPYTAAIAGATPPRNRYANTSTMRQFPGRDLSVGNQDPVKQEVVR